MTAKTRLCSALNAIREAKKALQNVVQFSQESEDIKKAIQELGKAESDIRSAKNKLM